MGKLTAHVCVWQNPQYREEQVLVPTTGTCACPSTKVRKWLRALVAFPRTQRSASCLSWWYAYTRDFSILCNILKQDCHRWGNKRSHVNDQMFDFPGRKDTLSRIFNIVLKEKRGQSLGGELRSWRSPLESALPFLNPFAHLTLSFAFDLSVSSIFWEISYQFMVVTAL